MDYQRCDYFYARQTHFSQKSSHQRERGHSTLAERAVWSHWPWRVLRGFLVFNIPLVSCPCPRWRLSSPLLQRGRLKLTYSLTAPDPVSRGPVCRFYLFVQPSVDLPNGRSLLSPPRCVSISIPAECPGGFSSVCIKRVVGSGWEARLGGVALSHFKYINSSVWAGRPSTVTPTCLEILDSFMEPFPRPSRL